MVDGPYLDPSGEYRHGRRAYQGHRLYRGDDHAVLAATDVGRHLRLFSQPPLWVAATAYTAGQNVTDASGAWWTAIINSTGVVPGTPTVVSGVQQLAWAPAPLAGSWAWGIITGYTSSSEVSFTYDTTIPNMVLQTANGTTIEMFQLGVYTATPTVGIPGPVYPTCGLNLQGRLWFAGAVANRFDTTISNGVNLGIATFSPTDPYGNVLDDSGISEIINSPYIAQINWMIGEDAGVVMGTISGEFLVFSSATNDPITPTNIDERLITKLGSQFIDPVRAGMATVFVHKFGRRAIEYLADAFSGKFSGRHLNKWSKHLSAYGIAQLAYHEETFPCVWAIMNNGLLAGCTYRRFSRFASEPADIAAWQRVVHGRQRSFTSMAVVPGKNGLLDRLFTITNDPTPPNQSPVNNYYIEIMQPVFDEGTTALNGWFCDQAQPPGPGRSGYDCGGGNASIFSPTGGTIGSDSTTPDVSNLLPYSNNGSASPAVGQPLGLISAGPASYFDGTTALYMLPTVNANETSVSLSVWVASEDFPLQAGALFGSTALTGAELVAGATCAASILNGGTNLATAASGPTGYPFGSPPSVSDGGALAGGQVWNNVLISMKSNGSGGIVVTAAMNETVLVSSTTATALEDHTAVWKFAGQPTTTKDGNVCAFTIGGQDPTGQNYTITDTYGQVAVTPYTIPTLSQIVASLFQNIPLNEQGYPPWTEPGKAGSPVRPFTSANLVAVPAYLNYVSSLAAQQASTAEIVTSQIVSGNAQGNIPLDDPLGGYSGYRGSVAELLIWPGVFIDWTSSTNLVATSIISIA